MRTLTLIVTPGLRCQVLVTCTRNQAINAVAEKVSGIEGGILAFVAEKSLREIAKRYTLREVGP